MSSVRQGTDTAHSQPRVVVACCVSWYQGMLQCSKFGTWKAAQ